MTLALGAFVWGLASHPYTRTHTHTHRLPITSPHHHLPLNPLHLWLSAPRLPARQSSSYGVTATRDWPTPTKEMLIDKRRQRTVCSVSERWAGRWWMMLVSQSVPGLLCCQHGSLQRRCQFIFTSDSNFYLLLKVFFPPQSREETIRSAAWDHCTRLRRGSTFCMDVFFTNQEISSWSIIIFKDIITHTRNFLETREMLW